MGYDFWVRGGVKPKEKCTVPWPCKGEPDRTIDLYPDDVLTRQGDGRYFKQTGIGCFNIVLTEDQIEPSEDRHLMI